MRVTMIAPEALETVPSTRDAYRYMDQIHLVLIVTEMDGDVSREVGCKIFPLRPFIGTWHGIKKQTRLR